MCYHCQQVKGMKEINKRKEKVERDQKGDAIAIAISCKSLEHFEKGASLVYTCKHKHKTQQKSKTNDTLRTSSLEKFRTSNVTQSWMLVGGDELAPTDIWERGDGFGEQEYVYP